MVQFALEHRDRTINLSKVDDPPSLLPRFTGQINLRRKRMTVQTRIAMIWRHVGGQVMGRFECETLKYIHVSSSELEADLGS